MPEPSMAHAHNPTASLSECPPHMATMVANFKKDMEDEKDLSASVHAIRGLTAIIKQSTATTVMGLTEELNCARGLLEQSVSRHNMALSSGCDLFLRFVTRTSLEAPNFEECKQNLIERGNRFASMSLQARKKISSQAKRFIKDGMTVLTHGFSRVVIATLIQAAQEGSNFRVIVTESMPDQAGQVTVKHLVEAGIPVTVILDAGVARVMEKVDLVIVGAEGVVENGGIINKIGTYQVTMAANSLKKRVYVVAESFKFVRLYPLGQSDLPESHKNVADTVEAPGSDYEGAFRDSSLVDYTPPQYITLLFTDLGIFAPSAVSDELIKLYA